MVNTCRSFVYPYPSVSGFAGRSSDHGRSKTRTKTQTTPDSVFIGGKEKLRPCSKFLGRENSDHGLSLGCFWGRGRWGALKWASCIHINYVIAVERARQHRNEPNLSGRHGGVEKRGGWKTSRMTPLPKRGFGPPLYGTFSTPLTCQCSVFPVQKSTTEQTRSSFGGVQKFSGERVLWYVFHPPYVLHPPISRPKNRAHMESRDLM